MSGTASTTTTTFSRCAANPDDDDDDEPASEEFAARVSRDHIGRVPRPAPTSNERRLERG